MGAIKRKVANGKQIKGKEDEKKKPKYWDPLIEGVKWVEKYSDTIERFHAKLPEFLGTIVATTVIITFAGILRGEWVVILVAAFKQFTGEYKTNSTNVLSLFTEENLKMENFTVIFICSHAVSFGMYFLLGGLIHWYYYVKKKHLAHEWKIQPEKWITPELERDEIMLGTLALLVVGSFSAFLSCYIMNGNPSTVYFQVDEYGWLWFFLQFPLNLLYNDYSTYLIHRFYHTPFMYRHFHKLHHKYKQPTVFSVTAMHPVELLHIQMVMCLPLFVVPCHWFPFYFVAMYVYYHGIICHTGVNFKSKWWQPWQPDAVFHDLHHQLFHINFGFNVIWWDQMHGTIRKPNVVYTEDTYYGDAPDINTEEAKAALEKDPEAIEYILKEEE